MCRLLGVVSRRPIDLNLLMEFRHLAETGKVPKDYGCEQISTRAGHPEGWGIACLSGDGEVYKRSHLKATADPLYERAVEEVRNLSSPPFILLAHLRRASRLDTVNVDFNQPYRRELAGRIIFFAHNGNIEGYGVREGRIDSQAYFERLLARIGEAPLEAAEFKKRVGEVKTGLVTEFPKKVSSLTFVMSDGEEVIGHRDAKECTPYYSLHQTKTEDAFVICSEVMRSVPGKWRLLRNGETVSFPVTDI